MKKNKPTILVDMDDTIAGFSKEFWKIHNEVFSENINPSLVNEWTLSNVSGKGETVYELFKYPGLFRNLPALPFAKEFISNMQKISDVYIVSDTPPGTSFEETISYTDFDHSLNFPHSNPADDKRMWIKEHFPNIPQKNIIFCGCKWMIQGDILIDDKPDTFHKFKEMNRDIILIDMPYNRYIKTKWRAHNLKEAEEMVHTLLSKNSALVC